MFRLLVVAVITAVIFFVAGLFLGSRRKPEQKKEERELWDFTKLK